VSGPRLFPPALNDAATEPICPPACAFGRTCTTWEQQGVAPLWASGRIAVASDCVLYAHRAKVHRETTGRDVPVSAEALLDELAERRAIAEESA